MCRRWAGLTSSAAAAPTGIGVLAVGIHKAAAIRLKAELVTSRLRRSRQAPSSTEGGSGRLLPDTL
jgi:hypothetical protein